MGLSWCGLLLASMMGTVPSGLAQTPEGSEEDVVGYLTWNNGKGGIVWDPAAPTEAMPARSFDGAYRNYVGQAARDNGFDLGSSLESTTRFVSDPVPKTLYVNVSRLIILENVGTSSRLDAQLWMEGVEGAAATFVAGVFYRNPSESRSMASEVHVIPEGSTLLLVVRDGAGWGEVGAYYQQTYSFSGSLRSKLWIPVYSSDDVVLRFPGVVDSSQPESDPSNPEHDAGKDVMGAFGMLGLGSSAVFSVAALSCGGLARKGGRALVGVALLVVLSFAGCLGSSEGQEGLAPSAASGGSLNTTLVNNPPGSRDGFDANGSIVGLVRDDLNRPVSEARVVLLGYGVGKEQSSDSRGRFSFQGLESQAYTLKAFKNGFREFEGALQVERGMVTRVELTLLPLDPSSRDAISYHPHDYWGEKKEITIMDGDVDVAATGCVVYTIATAYRSCRSTPTRQFSIPLGSRGAPNLVLPGTYDVEAVVTWDDLPGSRVSSVSLSFLGNHGASWTAMYPKGSGVATHIRTNWEMTDRGHQEFTAWGFLLTVVGDLVQDAQFHVNLRIHKGVVPLDPPHPDHWQGAPSVVIHKSGRQALSHGVFNAVLTRTEWPETNWGVFEKPVPPETTWLELLLNHTFQSTLFHTVDPPPKDMKFYLNYKTAEKPAQHQEYRKVMPDSEKEWTDNGQLYETIRFVVPVQIQETDHLYAARSNWMVTTGATNYDNVWSEVHYLDLRVIAHRDAMVAGG